jgi:hypothetical protein
MRNDLIGPKFKLAIFRALLAGLALAVAQPAAAWDDWGTSSGWGGSYYYYDSYDASEAREDAQEAAREAGREKRREEVEQKKAADSAAHDAYFNEILDASQAAVGAPRGVYYRKPGYVSNDPPGTSAQVLKGEAGTAYYDQGIFWVKQGNQYVVVTAPYGVVVDTIPSATTRVATKEGEYGYFFGTFFQRKDSKFVIAKPPAGLKVTYLPDGYEQVGTKEAPAYKFGNITFKPVMAMGTLVYQVVQS